MKRILVVGATGTLGKYVINDLKKQGYWVRVLTRSEDRLAALKGQYDEFVLGDLESGKSLGEAVQGVDGIISCAGASLGLKNIKERRTFHEVDYLANKNLLDAARGESIKKFVYTAFLDVPELRKTAYIQAHENFITELRASGIPSTIVRPTAFFSILLEFLDFAKKGLGVVIGSGKQRINPIHEKDVARAVVEALKSDAQDLNVGGPETFTRDDITRLALSAAGKKDRLFRIPIFLNRILSQAMLPINRRIYQMLHFGNTVHSVDAVAPSYGQLRLEDYFREEVESS